MDWIESNGGPLILLQERQVKVWGGTGEGEWHPGSGTDYDRACQIDEWLGLVDLDSGKGLVLGGEPFPTAVLWEREGVVLVRWVHGPEGWPGAELDPDDVKDWESALNWEIMDERVVLQDSAVAGPEAEGRLELATLPRSYEVLTAQYRPNPEIWMILHWIRRQNRLGNGWDSAVS